MSNSTGRHRAAGRYNPAAEIGQIITEAGAPLAKGSAVVAASGGLVAAIAIPAQAATVDTPAPAAQALTAVGETEAETAVVALEQSEQVAVTAPEKSSKKATQAFGEVAVEPVAKPTGPTEAELRERAEREAAEQAEAEAAEREAAEQAEREAAEREAAERAAGQERQEEAASRSQERTAPAPAETTSEPAPSTSGGVIGIAKQYIGTPYVYGGSTPAGFDCSGFTQYVFAQIGVSLPRTAEQQRQMATPVSDPQPGDLVFFGAPAYHMGIYVGDGMMIDSPRTGSTVSIRPVFSGVSGYGRV